MYHTDDPIADFNRWDAERAEKESRLPLCCYCDQRVQDDYFYLINDEVVCEECLNNYFRHSAEDNID